jgi:hypothetical protein
MTPGHHCAKQDHSLKMVRVAEQATAGKPSRLSSVFP